MTADAATGRGPATDQPLPRAAVGAPAGPGSPSGVVETVVRFVEVVAAPIGVVTGLLVYFGGTYSGAYYGYFGINQRLLQHSLQEQMLHSAQPMFGTAALLLALVGALWLLDRTSNALRQRPDRVGRSARTLVFTGCVAATGFGLLFVLDVGPADQLLPVEVAALVMLGGSLVLLRLRWRARPADRGRTVERALTVTASLLAAFWVTTVYATEAGEGIARQVDAAPGTLPLVTLFSQQHVDLPGAAVTLTRQESPEGTPLYRYTGLRLLAYSNDRWFLVTGAHDGYRPTVAVVRDRPELRFEVARQD